jgi:hypothetical protein
MCLLLQAAVAVLTETTVTTQAQAVAVAEYILQSALHFPQVRIPRQLVQVVQVFPALSVLQVIPEVTPRLLG